MPSNTRKSHLLIKKSMWLHAMVQPRSVSRCMLLWWLAANVVNNVISMPFHDVITTSSEVAHKMSHRHIPSTFTQRLRRSYSKRYDAMFLQCWRNAMIGTLFERLNQTSRQRRRYVSMRLAYLKGRDNVAWKLGPTWRYCDVFRRPNNVVC